MMHEIKVKRVELLAIVRTNREAHRDLFLKAQEGFREQVIERLDTMLAEARKGKRVNLYVSLPEPVDQTKEYDRVIKALEMSIEDTIELSSDEFAHYVMDEWSWAQNATSMNTMYASSMRVR